MIAFMRYLILLLTLIVQTSCIPLDPLYHTQTYVFGTLVDISIYGEEEPQAAQITSQITREFQQIHNRLHAWKPSDLNGINHTFTEGRPKLIEPDIVNIIQDASQLSIQSEGLFNPAIGKLIKAWGFQRDEFTPVIPDETTIKTLLAEQPKMTDIVINGRQIISNNPNVKLDLGGYAKGYALDVGLKLLNEFHVEMRSLILVVTLLPWANMAIAPGWSAFSTLENQMRLPLLIWKVAGQLAPPVITSGFYARRQTLLPYH